MSRTHCHSASLERGMGHCGLRIQRPKRSTCSPVGFIGHGPIINTTEHPSLRSEGLTPLDYGQILSLTFQIAIQV